MHRKPLKIAICGLLTTSTLAMAAPLMAEARPASGAAITAAPSADPLAFQLPAVTDLGVPTTVDATLTRFVRENGQLAAVLAIAEQTVTVPVTDLVSNTACTILDLTLGPIHLDLLGLVVDLNQVHLQLTAEPGAGNLLGNLLCAVAGLFDNGSLGGLTRLLNSILGLLNISVV